MPLTACLRSFCAAPGVLVVLATKLHVLARYVSNSMQPCRVGLVRSLASVGALMSAIHCADMSWLHAWRGHCPLSAVQPVPKGRQLPDEPLGKYRYSQVSCSRCRTGCLCSAACTKQPAGRLQIHLCVPNWPVCCLTPSIALQCCWMPPCSPATPTPSALIVGPFCSRIIYQACWQCFPPNSSTTLRALQIYEYHLHPARFHTEL